MTFAALVALASAGARAAGTRLLRFPDIHADRIVFSYAGDLWTVGAEGGTATRLTADPGLELFAKFSPDGRSIAFTGQYSGDEQVYVVPAAGGAPKQLTFYPAAGPLPDRWGYDNQVYGWTPDGSAVLFRSARDGYMLSDTRLYTVPAGGGASRALPMPVSGAGDFSPDGKKIVYSPQWRDFRSEKRYQGGWANDLYIFDLAKPDVVRVTDDPHADRDPMWIGTSIYFNSDRDGVFNLYRYDIATGQTSQITHHRDWDVRWPSSDGKARIVYECDGELHVLDVRSLDDRTLSIVVPADATLSRPRAVNAADDIETLIVSPGGERIAIAARGDVFSVPVEHGVTRNLTHSSDAHDREPAWSADGRQVVYVSDRSGEEEVYLQPQDGSAPARAMTSGSAHRYYAPRISADGRRIAVADSTGTLYSVDLASRRKTEIARDPADLAEDYRWSPDGRYLAYSLNDADNFAGVFVWSAADGKSRRITPPGFNAHTPAWAPNGEMLYYLSERDYPALLSAVEFEFVTDRQTGIFAVTLRKDVKNVFGVRDDAPGDHDHDEEDADGADGASNGSDDGTAGGRTRGPGVRTADGDSRDCRSDEAGAPRDVKACRSARRARGTERRPIAIDFDGIVGRAIRVPLEAGDLSNLTVGKGNLLYQRGAPYYYGRDPAPHNRVMSYSIKSREARTVIQGVTEWSATADGRYVVAQLPDKEIKSFDTAESEESKDDDAKAVSLAGLETTRVAADEWREIFAESWRRYRDYFYVANMHGFDWTAVREKYRPLLEHVGSRADLNYVIAEMIAELTVQHAYIEGGDLGLPRRPFVALAGARFALDEPSGRYRISKIFAGQNEEERYRSPLTEVGVDVHVGDYVLAINGRELRRDCDPYEMLEAPANQPAEWRVAATPDGRGARTIRYQPLANENALKYLEHVTAARARVERASGGRLGYIHIPDMAENGLHEFIKWWYPQVRKEGLVVDVRDNGGGNVSELLISRLARTLHGLSYARNHAAPETYPRTVQSGPKVALINEGTGSDGDIFAYAFRQWRIGATIGTRTWGGVVGITDHGPLLDGGSLFVPEFGTADEHGHWIIEGHGVDPDIVVEQDPLEVIEGRDPQLERAVTELMKRLPSDPQGLPPHAPPPIKAPTAVPASAPP